MKIRAIYLYLILGLWVGFLALLIRYTHFNLTGLGITLSFLTLIFTPGILLWRICGPDNEEWPVKFLYIVGLGFGFYFLINFLGILLNLTIYQVLWISLVLVVVLFVICIWRDFKKEMIVRLDWLKNLTFSDWLLWLILVAASGITFFVLDAQSEKFIGDGYFHFAILQKVVSAPDLDPLNLWVVKTESLNPVYSFPIWHILVGEFSKLLNISIFTALKQVMPSLGILSMLVWYSFMVLILKNKYLVAVAFLSFLLIFLHNNTFYYLVAVSSPDSFNRLFWLPLIMGIIVNYLFGQMQPKVLNIVFVALLSVFLGLIHFIQFLYLIIILLVFGILLLFLSRQKQPLVRLLYLLGGLIILISPYLFLQFNTILSFLLANIVAFKSDTVVYNTYLGANLFYRYAILSLPILLLFFRKQTQFLFLSAIMIAALIIYWPYFGLRPIFYKFFGQIFVARSLANIPHFIFFGFLLFLIILGVNYLLTKTLKKYIWLADVMLILIFLSLHLFKEPIVQLVDGWFLNESKIFYGVSFWIAFGSLAVSTGLILYFYRRKELILPIPSNKLNFVIITVCMFSILSLPYWSGIKKVLANNPNGSIISNRQKIDYSEMNRWGGEKTTNFFQSKSRSVFLTDNVMLARMILLYSDNFASEYPYSITEFSESKRFYDNNLSQNERLAILDNLKVDYILIRKKEQLALVENDPKKFRKIFENQYIYDKVERSIYVFQYLK